MSSHTIAFLLGGALGLVGMALICERAKLRHNLEWDHPGLGQSELCQQMIKAEIQKQQQQQQQQQPRQQSQSQSQAQLLI